MDVCNTSRTYKYLVFYIVQYKLRRTARHSAAADLQTDNIKLTANIYSLKIIFNAE